jgi:hypothetical protein
MQRKERLSAQSNGRDGGSSGGGVTFSFSYKELIATGLVGALLALLASWWKLPGVLIGTLSPMVSGVIMAIVKAYSSGAALGGPRLPGLLYILGAFWWFASREAGVRQAILFAGLRAGLVSTVISASVVAGTQAIAGEDLSCLVWEECHRVVPIKMQQPVTPTSAPGVVKQAVPSPSASSSSASSSSASPSPPPWTTTPEPTTLEPTTLEPTTPQTTTPQTTTPQITTPQITTP